MTDREHPEETISYPGSEEQMSQEPGDEMRDYTGTGLLAGRMDKDNVRGFGTDTPMGRATQPDEIAPSFVFFAGNQLSSYYTGEVLAPIGGYTLPG